MTDKRKIVFFSGDMSRSGGTERVLSLIANGLVERGHEVVIFSLTGKAPSFFELDERIRIRWVGSKGLETNIISNLITLNKFMKEEKPDFLIDVDIILCFYSGLLKLKFPKTHWISWEHFNYYTKFPVNHNLRKVARFIVSRFSECLIVLSDEDKGYYQSNMKLKCRIERIYNPTPFKEPFKKTIEEKTVVAVGRLTKIKGFDMLLKSWRPVERKHPDWTLKIIGEGEEKDSLTKLASLLKLQNIDFEGLSDDVSDYYKHASFIVLSSRSEGLGMVLLEAMSFSLPGVAFNCPGGVSEVIEDGINGYLVPAGDIKALARKIDFMICNEAKRHEMGKASTVLIDKFSQNTIIDKWEELLSSFN